MMDTQRYELILSQCESKEEYEQLVREHQDLYVDWRSYLRPLLRERRITYKSIAEGCEVSEASARSFLRKIPAKRENVIMLAMLMRLTVAQTNEMLTRWAKFQKLYARNPSDAIWIFLLEKGGSSHPRALFRRYYEAYEAVREEYGARNAPKPSAGAMNTRMFHAALLESAQATAGEDAQVDPEFIRIMRLGMPSFEHGYQKLLDYINSFFTDPEAEDNRRWRLEETDYAVERNTPNRVFGEDASWKDAYYRKLRALEREQIMPCRAFLIALGLRLGLDTEHVNKLLDLAGMGPLCPKDRLEGTVVFYLEELSCNFPSYFYSPDSIDVGPEYNLADYSARDEAARRQRNAGARDLFEIPDIALDHEDNPVESLNDYIKRAVMDTDVFEFGYDDYIAELLDML